MFTYSYAGVQSWGPQPTSVVRNTLGKELVPHDPGKPISDEALLKYCDKNYHQILPIIAEKVHQEKAQQEKLKAVKARLNFEETSHHSESGTPIKRIGLKERLGPRYVRSRSGSPEPRRGRSESPKKKGPERKAVFKRLEKGVFHRLGDKGKSVSVHSDDSRRRSYYSSRRDTESCHQSSRSRATKSASERRYNKRASSRRTEELSESEGSAGGHWKSKLKRAKSSIEDDLSQPWSAAKTERWAMQHGVTGKFKAPPPVTTPVEKQNHAKFCEFHGEVGHNTDECMHLRKQIEEMIKAGKLSHLIKELKQNNGKEKPKVTKKGETSGKDKALAILMKSFFRTLGEDEGTEGPMIIEVELGGHYIHRMYVDGGSASEILYEHCFSRLHPEIKNQLMPATTPLIRLGGEVIWPIGQIQLLVKIRDEEHSASAWMNFVVVRSPSPYNGIIRRPGVRKLQAVPSTAHGMLEIPVERGVITLKSSKLIPLECTMVSEPERTPSATKPIIEERIKVAINPEYPEQTAMIGSTLTEEGRNKLCNLFQ
ncbi:hypothetical protein Tco_0867979 [Tanacetum coccineum]